MTYQCVLSDSCIKLELTPENFQQTSSSRSVLLKLRFVLWPLPTHKITGSSSVRTSRLRPDDDWTDQAICEGSRLMQLYCNESSSSVQGGYFLDKLSDSQLLRLDFSIHYLPIPLFGAV